MRVNAESSLNLRDVKVICRRCKNIRFGMTINTAAVWPTPSRPHNDCSTRWGRFARLSPDHKYDYCADDGTDKAGTLSCAVPSDCLPRQVAVSDWSARFNLDKSDSQQALGITFRARHNGDSVKRHSWGFVVHRKNPPRFADRGGAMNLGVTVEPMTRRLRDQ